MEHTVIVLLACLSNDPECKNPVRQSWTTEMDIDFCYLHIDEVVDAMQEKFPYMYIYSDPVPCRSMWEKEL